MPPFLTHRSTYMYIRRQEREMMGLVTQAGRGGMLPCAGIMVQWMMVVCVLCCAVVVMASDGWTDGRALEDDFFAQATRRQQQMYQEQRGGGRPWGTYACGLVAGWVVDWWWGGSSVKRLNKRFKKDVADLNTKFTNEKDRILHLKGVQLQEYEQRLQDADLTIQQLQQAAVDAGVDLGVTQTQLDYDEFKQPDLNNDDMISRAEFTAYIQNYLKAYPHISKADIPRFEDFDINKDGIVTFSEWQKYLDAQRGDVDPQTDHQNELVAKMREQSANAQNFNQVHEQLRNRY